MITVPPSKSLTHRALVCAALAHGESCIVNPLVCEDTLATLRVLEQLGIPIEQKKNEWIIHGGTFKTPTAPLDCNASGTTLRFLTAITDFLKIPCTFTGTPRLLERGGRPDIQESSQYFSGLLLAAPLGKTPTTLEIKTSPVSKSYIEMTMDVQKKFGVDTSRDVIEPQSYKPCTYVVEGDWSSAAFLMAMGLLHKKIILKNLNPKSLQGDMAILSIVKEMGGNFKCEKDHLVVNPSRLKNISWNFGHTPDLYPIVSVLTHLAEGESHFEGTERLKNKESDRPAEMETVLKAHNGSVIDSKDHRIVMAAAVLALAKQWRFEYKHPEAVNKSFPDFWKFYEQFFR
ncbi:MAG: 3-phosphoshikimate 1-carboxyvinyltransferase [Deltaproteobacteria bacterium]|nr:3-phosphoshikimate 1-carboxyvinyltransferase [Deltaproteobacteria bacterium]